MIDSSVTTTKATTDSAPSSSSPSATSSPSSLQPSTFVLIASSLAWAACLQLLYLACVEAYRIRLYAVEEFGRVIHEFDPYFNYRATVYLYEHGWAAFSQWFDYLVWYPLGRPVGTTIYPGMQVTSVAIKNWILPTWSINDICVMVPAWFGVAATLAVAWLAYECVQGVASQQCIVSQLPLVGPMYQYLIKPVVVAVLRLLHHVTGSTWGLPYPSHVFINSSNSNKSSSLTPAACAVAAAAIMSIVPAHLLRSVAGGYDNESIAMTAMVWTFASWTCSLRDHGNNKITVLMGIATGIAYFYMVAAWGGYVFVLNMIGVHASVLVLLGRYSTKLHRAYTAFYITGTALAIQVPVVGWTPLKSLEQLGPLVAFVGMQLLEVCEILKRRRNLSRLQTWKLRLAVFIAASVVASLLVVILWPTGYFGPISARVRGLFVKHTKTGNPLVDSVAEHQAASSQAYFQYLNVVCYIAPIGFALTGAFYFNDSSSFLLVYGLAAYYFSHRMVRLILLTAPIASVCAGIALGRLAAWMMGSLVGDQPLPGLLEILTATSGIATRTTSTISTTTETDETQQQQMQGGKKTSMLDNTTAKNGGPRRGGSSNNNNKVTKNGNKAATAASTKDETVDAATGTAANTKKNAIVLGPAPLWVRAIRVVVSAAIVYKALPFVREFHTMAHAVAKQISHPTIINKAQTRNGDVVLVDDYREAYFWLRDHTSEDARIMAWWDYGYQITGIGNRTSIADGNTWNHEHIALLGRILTGPEKEAHRIARHLADYVLLWTGGGGDDLAKSPHLRRIANSVYRGLCREPTCSEFGFYSDHKPTRSMSESLLYKLHSNGLVPGVEADRNRFREVFSSKYGKVRIYKILAVSIESKDWVANPANRICDAPGSWYCRGQYPPALKKVLKEKKDFRQLEDFNVKDGGDEDYTKEYLDNLLGGDEKKKRRRSVQNARNDDIDSIMRDLTPRQLAPEQIDMLNEDWENNQRTTFLYELISQNQIEELAHVLSEKPELAHIRSEDGRGPMFWAHEMGRRKMVELLKIFGVSDSQRRDSKGLTPLDISKLKKRV